MSTQRFPRRPPKNRAGLSLVELAVSVTILSTTLLGALRGQVASRRLMQEAHDTELAVELLHETLMDLREQTVDELADDTGTYAPNRSLVVDEMFHGQDVRYTTPGYTAGDPVPEILIVELQVSWVSSTGQTRNLSLQGGVR